MRYASVTKAIEDEQQNQTTTNINYIKKFVRFKTKLNNKVQIASDKSETKQNNLQFTRKDMGTVHNKAWQQLGNKEQKQ